MDYEVDPVVVDRLVHDASPVESNRTERVAATRRLCAMGWTNGEVAARLRVTKRTVERYRVELGIAKEYRKTYGETKLAVLSALLEEPLLSDRRLAIRLGVQKRAVWDFRRDLTEAGLLPNRDPKDVINPRHRGYKDSATFGYRETS